jgi:hypothetical protein
MPLKDGSPALLNKGWIMDFYIALRRWSDRPSDEMADLYQLLSDQPDFDHKLISALDGDETIHRVVTWLMKHHLELKQEFDGDVVEKIFSSLDVLNNWEAKLHLLQCLPYIRIPATYRSETEAFVKSCLTEINKFVRAWAYNGMYELACQFPDMRPEAEKLFNDVADDEAASVKARIRNIQKQGFPTVAVQAS